MLCRSPVLLPNLGDLPCAHKDSSATMLQVIGALSRRRGLGTNKMDIRRDSTAVGEMSGRCLIGVGSSAWRGTVLPLMGEKVWKCTNQRKDLKAGVALACLKNQRPCDRTQ